MKEEKNIKRYIATAKGNLALADNPGATWKKGEQYDLIYNNGAYELASDNATVFYTESAFKGLGEEFDIKEVYDRIDAEQEIQQKILEIQEGFMRWDADTAVRMRNKMSGLAEALEIVRAAKNQKEVAG